MRRRDWAFYVQVLGLFLIWSLAFLAIGWFIWRGMELRSYHDAWLQTVVLGVPIGGILICFAGLLTYLFVKIGATADGKAPELVIDQVEEALTHSVAERPSWRFRAVLLCLGLVTAWGLYAWWVQLRYGLSVTGLGRPIFWGLYITNFVFFIGMSYGGTLVSAILRLTNGEWRRSITRAAEGFAVISLAIGAWNIILDLGRPDRLTKVFVWGRMESPLLWDVVAISLYLITCVLYFYLPLIPDLALLRHRVKGFRRPLYHLFSFGWVGTVQQQQALERAIRVITGLVVPIAVSVHSVVGWVFSMTVQPVWHSTIFGPYFVLGAMFSGVAALILLMAILRRALSLQSFLRPLHFQNLGFLLLVLSLLWFYFTAAEHLTIFYGREHSEMHVLNEKLTGGYAPLTYMMLVGCFVLPVLLLARKKMRTITGTVIASIGVCIGMWLERFLIVVPSLAHPRLPYPASSYTPLWVEVSLMVGCFAALGFLVMLFVRLFPVVSLWEVREGREEGAESAAARVRSYFPTGHTIEKGASL